MALGSGRWFRNTKQTMTRSLYFIIISASILLASSCGTAYKKKVKAKLQFSDYTAYVFRLCETRNEFGNKRFFLCDSPCEATDVQANDDIQVVEELYVFRSNINPGEIVYISSKSDKAIRENHGIFNDSLYQKHIFVEDFEYVYFGNLQNSHEISFVNAEENLSFKLQAVPEVCRFVVDSIYSETDIKNTISNKKISMLELFSVPIQFLETDRTLVYKRKKPFAISSLELTGAKLIYSGESATHTMSQRLRLKYHPEFLEEQAVILRKDSQ
jgi:hypothetical protein